MAFVVSQGAVQGLSRPNPTLSSAGRISLSPMVHLEYFEIWRTQPAVRRAVSFLARNIAQLGIHLYERRGDTDRQRVTDHPLAQLLMRPNPWTTRYRFLSTLIHDFAIYDNAYWWKVKGGDSGPRLVHLPAPLMTPKGDNWLTPDYFEFRGQRGVKLIPVAELVYFRGYGGISDSGISPIEALRQVLREEWTAGEMRESVMRNGARHSGYLQRPIEAPKWSEDARARFKREWQGQYGGDYATDAGGTPLLEDGITFEAASQTAEELQYIEGRKLTDEEVTRAYFIPPPMVGILDKATFSNITEQHKMLYQDCLGPPLVMVQDEIELQLLPDFEPVDPYRFYTEFNLMEKLTGNVEQRDASITQSVGAPWRTINEGRALANLPPVDGGDLLVRPLNVTQNGDQNPIPADPATDNEELPPTDPAQEDENAD